MLQILHFKLMHQPGGQETQVSDANNQYNIADVTGNLLMCLQDSFKHCKLVRDTITNAYYLPLTP